MSEFIACAKAILPYVSAELFRVMTGVDLVHVPYRNAYLADLLAGQVQAAFTPISTSLDFIAQGRLRPLGVTSAERSDVLRDVPAIGEVLPGYAAYIWDAIAGPRDMPAEVVATLSRETNAVLADPAIRARLIALGTEPMVMSPPASGRIRRRRDREMGQRDPHRRHQGRVMWSTRAVRGIYRLHNRWWKAFLGSVGDQIGGVSWLFGLITLAGQITLASFDGQIPFASFVPVLMCRAPPPLLLSVMPLLMPVSIRNKSP